MCTRADSNSISLICVLLARQWEPPAGWVESSDGDDGAGSSAAAGAGVFLDSQLSVNFILFHLCLGFLVLYRFLFQDTLASSSLKKLEVLCSSRAGAHKAFGLGGFASGDMSTSITHTISLETSPKFPATPPVFSQQPDTSAVEAISSVSTKKRVFSRFGVALTASDASHSSGNEKSASDFPKVAFIFHRPDAVGGGVWDAFSKLCFFCGADDLGKVSSGGSGVAETITAQAELERSVLVTGGAAVASIEGRAAGRRLQGLLDILQSE